MKRVTVEIIGLLPSIVTDDENVSVKTIEAQEPEDWGDEDCQKMVTPVTKAIVILSKDVSKKIIKETNNKDFCLSGVRYDYFTPCYYFKGEQLLEYQDDGSIKITVG